MNFSTFPWTKRFISAIFVQSIVWESWVFVLSCTKWHWTVFTHFVHDDCSFYCKVVGWFMHDVMNYDIKVKFCQQNFLSNQLESQLLPLQFHRMFFFLRIKLPLEFIFNLSIHHSKLTVAVNMRLYHVPWCMLIVT